MEENQIQQSQNAQNVQNVQNAQSTSAEPFNALLSNKNFRTYQ